MENNSFDPYRGRGGLSPNDLNRRDDLLNDEPYRHHDPYRHNDPYRHHDPYRHYDPYEKRGGVFSRIENFEREERERFSFFWFWIKREIQLLFNAEAGAQDQDLVFPIEEDFMKLRIGSKFFVRNVIAFFVVLVFYWVFFLILGQIDNKFGELKFIFAIIYFFILTYMLFLPTHQIVSSFEYTIFKNVKFFYRRVATLFSSYRNSIFFAILLNIVIGGIFLYKPSLLHIVLKKNHHLIEFFKSENVKSAYILLTGVSIFTIILYIFFYKLVFSIAKKNREEHLRNYRRKKSEFYRYTSSLDED